MHLGDEGLRIDRLHRRAHGWPDRYGITRSANQPISAAERSRREKEQLLFFAVQREMPMVANEANHRERLGRLGANSSVDALADRRFLAECELRRLVVDHHQPGVLVFV